MLVAVSADTEPVWQAEKTRSVLGPVQEGAHVQGQSRRAGWFPGVASTAGRWVHSRHKAWLPVLGRSTGTVKSSLFVDKLISCISWEWQSLNFKSPQKYLFN